MKDTEIDTLERLNALVGDDVTELSAVVGGGEENDGEVANQVANE